ncbi:MAG TPA: mechanosensitive ion channel domain-containing protein [Candidatus Babeliales bacterium]|nr:mechanosensitive ion channel domain-containing protein [Candidatus Babeliales bacterium]
MNLRLQAIVIFLLTQTTFLCASNLVETLEKTFLGGGAGEKIHFTAVAEKTELFAELKKESQTWYDSQQMLQEEGIARLQEIKVAVDATKRDLKIDPANPFLAKKLLIINDNADAVSHWQQLRERIGSILNQLLTLLEDYLKDPNQTEYKKKLGLQVDLHSFDNLQTLNQLIADGNRNAEQLKELEKNITVELKNRKQIVSLAEQAHKKSQDERNKQTSCDFGGFDAQQKVELFALDDQRYADERKRDSLRIKEIEYKQLLIKNRLFVQQLQIDVLKNVLSEIKPAVRVSEDDIAIAVIELNKKKQEAAVKKEQYAKEAEYIGVNKNKKSSELKALSEHHGILLSKELDSWEHKPIQTAAGYRKFVEVASFNDAVQLLQSRANGLEAKSTLENEKIRYESVHIAIMRSFYKIITKQLKSELEAAQEIVQYDHMRADVWANISSYKERLSSAQELLKIKKQAQENCTAMRALLQEKKETLFEQDLKEYAGVVALFNSADTFIKKHLEAIGVLISTYEDVLAVLQKTNKQLKFIVSELELATIWQRPEYAITWDGIQNIVPNILTFLSDLRKALFTFTVSHVQQSQNAPFSFILFMIQALVLLFVLWFAWKLLPIVARRLRSVGREYKGLRFICLLIVLGIEFLLAYYLVIAPWMYIFIFGNFFLLLDPYMYVLFYLGSIPYLLYVAVHFIHYFKSFNKHNDDLFFAQEFQRRFIMICCTSLYATIVILLFRKAYILAGYLHSELPDVLFLLWIIILQISLIFLLTKEQILGIIPERGDVWSLVRLKVDQYYYLILMLAVAVIIMSNPFVGFGKLVIYVFSRLLYTGALITIFYWLNIFLRRSMYHVFFTTEYEVARERFNYGKSIYSFCVIAVFLSFIFLGAIIGAKIWAWPRTLAAIGQWSDIIGWLKTPVLLPETAKISVFSVLQVLFFVLMGFIIAFLLNRFVLDKIFDVLLIEQGVQDTISSIVRYIIIIIAVILGFQSIDLVAFVWGLTTALAIGIGWVVKEPMGDFIAYFILLVQRPLKIGDYVQINEEVNGVVRKITPRSVILRRKNSTTIILPNSQIINQPVTNWNYLRGFIAFNDIVVTVGYKEDPTQVKELLLAILSANQYILKSPKPVVRLDNFTQNGFEFMVRGYINSNYTLDQWDIASDVRLAIVQVLRQHGITIAVPTRIIVQKDTVGADRIGNVEGPMMSSRDDHRE